MISYHHKEGVPLLPLKSCPSCGNIPKLIISDSDPEEGPGMGYWWFQVICNCGWSAKPSKYNSKETENSWNTRI